MFLLVVYILITNLVAWKVLFTSLLSFLGHGYVAVGSLFFVFNGLFDSSHCMNQKITYIFLFDTLLPWYPSQD
jgi:hypothetical protein